MKDRASLPRCVVFSLIDKAGLTIRHRRPCFFLYLSSRYGQKSNIQGGKLLLEMLARVPQVSRETFWCLREFRKSHGELFDACGSSARAIFPILTLAEAPQTPFSPFGRLLKFRKGHFPLFHACGNSARAIFPILMLAEVPQGPRKTFWRLQHRYKHFQKRFALLGGMNKRVSALMAPDTSTGDSSPRLPQSQSPF